MQLVGSRGQQVRDFMFDASGTIASGSAPQLILPEQPNRTALYLQNLHASATMFIQFGGALATCTITSGKVNSSVTVTNAGFGYTQPPRVRFYGGGDLTRNPTYLCPGLPGFMCPSKTASAHAVLSGSAIGSIVIDNPGGNYVEAPYVFLQASEQDPYGAAIPSATSGILLPPTTTPLIFGINGTVCSTDAISIFSSTATAAFTCKYTCSV